MFRPALGARLTHDSVTDVDLNTFATPGFNAYRVNLSNAQTYETYHFPIRDSGGYLTTINSDANVGIQIYESGSQNVGTICIRKKWGGTFTAWGTVYDSSILTNSSILSPLAAALGVEGTDAFGQNAGEYRDILLSYGLLLVRNYHTGSTCIYSVGNGQPYLIYPSAQEIQFSVTKVDSSHIRITKLMDGPGPYLRAKVLNCL